MKFFQELKRRYFWAFSAAYTGTALIVLLFINKLAPQTRLSYSAATVVELASLFAVPIALIMALRRSRSLGRQTKQMPSDAGAKIKLALHLHRQGELDQAESLYKEILVQEPEHPNASHFLAIIHFQKGRLAAALDQIERAITVNENSAQAHSDRAVFLQSAMRLDEALVSCQRAVELRPDYAEALNRMGSLLHQLSRSEEALPFFDHALELRPDFIDALMDRGQALLALRRPDEALATYQRAARVKPDLAEAFNNIGNVLFELKKPHDALANLERAIQLNTNSPETFYNRGNVLNELEQYEAAIASYDRAISLRPDYCEVLCNRARTLQRLKRLEEALADYDRALEINPEQPFLLGDRLYCRLMICDWHGLAEDLRQVAHKIKASKRTATPFTVLPTTLPAELQRSCAEIYVQEKHPTHSMLPGLRKTFEHHQIRLGYFSSDFRDHAVAYLIAGLFESHDRDQFEVIAFSSGSSVKDSMRLRIERSCDRFFDATTLSDKEVVQLARNLEIDIAINLNGFTSGERTNIFAMRTSPLQLSYLGYPGTMGADYVDYLVADRTVIPEQHQNHYTEKIVYLPDTYMPSDAKRRISQRGTFKAEHGLQENGFVFCSFNNSYKITPMIFDIWMRLLKRVDGSVLWLARSLDASARNLMVEANIRGVDPNRLVFAGFVANQDDHLARLSAADLFLDTLPYNAHATASDALWAGLPVVTCLGTTFAGRVAASLLGAVGLPELVTYSLDQYEAVAFELATKPQKLQALRQRLAANRLTHPMFNTGLYTRYIEFAYRTMVTRQRAGLRPEHIFVPPEPRSLPAC